jgi:hypothetical protein
MITRWKDDHDEETRFALGLFAESDGTEGGGTSGQEDGGEDAGGGSESEAKSESSVEEGSRSTIAVSKPEWLADKFWNPKDLVADLAQRTEEARSSAEKRLSSKYEDLKQEVAKDMAEAVPVGVPENPKGYEMQIRDSAVPEGVHVEISPEDPMLQFFQETAHKYKVPQSEFNEIINQYVSTRIAELPNYKEEMEALGEHGELRTERIMNWASSTLSPDSQEALKGIAVTAKINDETGNYNEAYSKAELKEMMNDERYWKNGGDPTYIAKVRAGFRRLANG